MPSPNGYFDCGSASVVHRGWFRYTVTHDINSPPWIPGQAGNYLFDFQTGPTALGPFTPAVLTGLADPCTVQGSNQTSPNGALSTLVAMGGPTSAFTPDTDVYIQVILYGPGGPEVDRFVCPPVHTATYPAFTPLTTNTTPVSASVLLGQTSGEADVYAPCDQDTVIWDLATTPGGPYTSTAPASFTASPSHTFVGLTPATPYYWRARTFDQNTGLYYTSPEQTFTTEAAPVTTPFDPQPCAGGGPGGGGADVEQVILCDLDASGNLLGTALAVYEYDATGNPVGAPTFVNPATGLPYTPTGTLQVCPDAACLPPMQFCQTSTTTGPVDHPGRQYDLTLPINPGFAVDSMTVDSVTHPAGLTWSIFDVDGGDFATALKSFIQSRIPGTTVTVTNPNDGATEICGAAAPMTVHIECLRLDQSPPNLVELVYNGGEDLVQNPAYNTTPPTDLSTGQFFYLRRQDAGGTLNCTGVANRGWETNDLGDANRDFEIWGNGPGGLQTISNTTPTPRGTPVQEITADINDTGPGPTIWQTFNVAVPGNFRVVLTHGARDPGEQHTIRLSTGDVNDLGTGDIINNVTTPPSVTNSGGPNPWTSLDTTVSLGAGVYTFSMTTTNPVGVNRGGLFTDMRVYVDRPGLRATATNNDTTCVVTTQETTTNTVCSFWQPQCVGGVVAGWERVEDGMRLTNAAFWAQTPTPECCKAEVAEGGGSSGQSNMLTSDLVCVTIGGIAQNAIRTVVTDPSGGTLQELFLGANGAPITPGSWVPGSCTTDQFQSDQVLCDFGVSPRHSFLRKFVQTVDVNGFPRVDSHRDFELDGSAVYLPTGPVGVCGGDSEIVELCDVQGGVLTPFLRRFLYDSSGNVAGIADTNLSGGAYTPVGTVGACDVSCDPYTTLGLCLADGTPIGVVTHRDCESGTVTRDGWINLLTGAFTAGSPPVGTVACGTSQSVQVSGTFCDMSGTTVNALVLIEYHYNPDGTIASVRLVNATTGATYTPVGTITTCPAEVDQPEQDILELCDVNAGVSTPFVRDYHRNALGAIIGFSDFTLAGAAYTPTGTVGLCALRDSESFILCDSAVTPNRFVRTYTYDAAGAIAGFTDRTLAGAAFTPTGAVGVCAQTVQSDTDFVEEILCDSNNTAFIRLFRFNSTTGALISTTNTTLAGAAFTPVGAVGLCSNCCPAVVGNGCTNTGSGFYTAIRAANGTISLIDSVTGAAVLAANIVPCPSDNTVRTLTAQARTLTNATPWTPGADVAGTLTSLTVTGVSGLWDLVDANGTAVTGLPAGLTLTWSAEDDNTLTGPQSVTPQAGASVVAAWTQR